MIVGLLILLCALISLFFFFSGHNISLDNLDGTSIAFIIIGGSLIFYYLSSLANDYRGRGYLGLRHLFSWCLLFLALLSGYAYRNDLSDFKQRLMAEIVPAGTPMSEAKSSEVENVVKLRKQLDGHFIARGRVNGSPIIMLVDTGASTVVLKPSDAERAGIDLQTLSYSTPVQTANGSTLAAPIRLRLISIGEINVEDIEALVAKPGSLNQSLLGMSFLKRLHSYEFAGDFLTLRG
ncbi:MAG: TIGR02281 family clan AA aspartic protease [Hyphomicrobium sp.]